MRSRLGWLGVGRDAFLLTSDYTGFHVTHVQYSGNKVRDIKIGKKGKIKIRLKMYKSPSFRLYVFLQRKFINILKKDIVTIQKHIIVSCFLWSYVI